MKALPSGDEGIRTLDPLLARQVLSQLSYTPIFSSCLPLTSHKCVASSYLSREQDTELHILFRLGLSGLEPPTSRLSGARSNQLSYKPICSGSHLPSRTVSSAVLSAGQVLTVVFGMGTGVTPDRIAARFFSP